jgi:hypothetical protein
MRDRSLSSTIYWNIYFYSMSSFKTILMDNRDLLFEYIGVTDAINQSVTYIINNCVIESVMGSVINHLELIYKKSNS